MKERIFFPSIVMVMALTILALPPILPVNTVGAQGEEDPCPKPYIKVITLRAGLPGDEVKIRGRRFGAEKGEVYFSPNVKADVVKWSMHRIYVVVPEAAVTGPVTVTVPCGAASNEQHFTIRGK